MHKTYKWDPQHKDATRTSFEHRGLLLMENAMNKLRTDQDKGKWMEPNIWEGFEWHRESKKFWEKKAIAWQNQAVDKGASSYTSSSKSAPTWYDGMVSLIYFNF